MVWIEKSVTRDHCSASLGKPRDADQWPSWQIFLSTPYIHDIYVLSQTTDILKKIFWDYIWYTGCLGWTSTFVYRDLIDLVKFDKNIS